MFGHKSGISSNRFGHKSSVSKNSFGMKSIHVKSRIHHPIQEDTTPKKSDLEKYTPHP